MNLSNCSTCEHKNHADGGWCYMFKEEPSHTCMKHTSFEPVRLCEHGCNGCDDCTDFYEGGKD